MRERGKERETERGRRGAGGGRKKKKREGGKGWEGELKTAKHGAGPRVRAGGKNREKRCVA